MSIAGRVMRYVIHEQVGQYEKNGWRVVASLHYPHSQYAVIMERVNEEGYRDDGRRVRSASEMEKGKAF